LNSRRQKKGNIEKIFKGWDYKPRKPEIGNELWPLLESKIKDASSKNNLNSIPVVQVLLESERYAAMTHRHDFGIRF